MNVRKMIIVCTLILSVKIHTAETMSALENEYRALQSNVDQNTQQRERNQSKANAQQNGAPRWSGHQGHIKARYSYDEEGKITPEVIEVNEKGVWVRYTRNPQTSRPLTKEELMMRDLQGIQ